MSERAPVDQRIQDLESELEAARFEQAGRPGEVGGVLEDVDGNRPVLAKDADIYFQGKRDKHYEDSMPANQEASMTTVQLARALASAEHDFDQTKGEDKNGAKVEKDTRVEDISDALLDRLVAAEDASHVDGDTEANNARSDALWNRVMGVTDKEAARLKEDSGSEEAAAEVQPREFAEGDVITVFDKKAGAAREYKVKLVATTKGKYGDKTALLEATDGTGDEMTGLYSGIQKSMVASKNEASGKEDTGETSAEDAKAARNKETVAAAVNRRAQRRAGVIEHDEKADLEDMQTICNTIMEAYDTDDVKDPRVQKAIQVTDERTIEKINTILKSNKDKGDKGNAKKEFVVTTDEAEARKYWEENIKDQGIPFEAYASHEGSWIVEREVATATPPTETTPPTTTPTEVIPPTKDVEGGDDGTEKTPVVEEVPTTPPRQPEQQDDRPEKKKGRARKFGRAMLALLALAPIGYVAGRAHENYIIKSHDVPELDANNKFADHIRDEPEAVQSDIANNWGTAQEFFSPEHGIATDVGKANFDNMEQAIVEEAAKLKQKHGDAITEKRAREVAESKVKAQLAALAAAEAEQKAVK